MGAGNLFGRCARCANRCRIRLVVSEEGTVIEARKQVPGHRVATYEECPNLGKNVGWDVKELEASQLVKR